MNGFFRVTLIRLLLISLTFGVLSSQAHAGQSSETTVFRNPHHIYGNLTFSEGGLALGADYEYSADRTYGLGGFARIYRKDDPSPGITAFGAFIRPHFHKKSWDLYFSPGLAVIDIDAAKDATGLGAIFSVGLIYQIVQNIAFGVENTRLYMWFNKDYRGVRMDELSLKLRVSF